MEFEWDEAKSDACLADRGFDFAHASAVFDDPRLWSSPIPASTTASRAS